LSGASSTLKGSGKDTLKGKLEGIMAGEIEAIKSWPKATKDYIDELKLEMRRVTWPSRKQVEATTTVVIICVFAFAAYFKIIDAIIEGTVTKTIATLSK
jgi:preprotein translocase subunit SecE